MIYHRVKKIARLLNEYDIRSAEDIQEDLKDLKTMYTAPSGERGYKLMVEVTDKWYKS